MFNLLGGILRRLNLSKHYLYAIFESLIDIVSKLKVNVLRRFFWGRTSWYKGALHLSVLGIAAILLLPSLISRFTLIDQVDPLVFAQAFTDLDVLSQGSSITAVLASNSTPIELLVSDYTVASGDTVETVATKFGISKDTVKWANPSIDYYAENISEGQVIKVPVMDGVLQKVEAGDSIEAIASRVGGNKFDLVELNRLVPPDYSLSGKEFIFVPEGKKAPPPPPIPVPNEVRYPTGGYIASGIPSQVLAGIAFDNPLSSPACAGYRFERGVSAWHDGVDLSKGGGCPIRSIAAGVVTYAGWAAYGSGYTVRVDHGNGVESIYLHGDGNIWVQTGQSVVMGQDIMYMGSTGNSTGTHVHLTIKYNRQIVDVSAYVPF